MSGRSQCLFFYTLFILILACGEKSPTAKNENPSNPLNHILVDSLATAETVALFENLRTLSPNALLFGHQDDVAYGVDWWAEPGRSDVKEVCGDFPAVYGWDLGDIGNETNLDGVNFEQMKVWIREIHGRGGINTLSMHLDNPATGGDAWDVSTAVRLILPGQPGHALYLKTLDKIAAFLEGLKASDGTQIPVILRPYHEHNHTWAWWGASACTAAEYTELWRMTVLYLRDTHAIHHLLYAISPQEISTEGEYLDRYPGDAWVDILGMDYYLLTDKAHITQLGQSLQVITTMAEARGKVSALTEVGIEKVPISDWWTNYLLAAVSSGPQSKKVAWALVWRNASRQHFFAPYPGQSSAADFVRFYQNSFTYFEKDLPDMYH